MSAPEEPTAPSQPTPEAITTAAAGDGVPAEGVQTEDLQTEPQSVPVPPPAVPALSPAERYLLWRRILDGALVAVILFLAFEIGFFPVRNSDLLLHRSVGRLIRDGQFDFHSDPFAFTTEGVRWVDHSWLFGWIVYGMNFWLKEPGDIVALIVFKSLLLAALAEIMLRLARRIGQPLWIPALCVGLAVLALSSRVLLQSICVSYLFLGLMLFLLEVPRRRLTDDGEKPLGFWNVRWLIPLLCVVWVNLDAWFFLGPTVVFLYLVGELLEGAKAPKGSVNNLAAVLVASFVACLLSPYHIHAFTLPDQLGLSPAAGQLKQLIAATLVSPWQSDYLNPGITSGVYRSVAGLSYYPLVFLGFASFILVPGSWRNWRGPVWVAFFILSALYARTIGFFAVVAGPITALNFLDYIALSPANAVIEDPERRRRLLTVRVLTFLLAFAAFTAGSAGWLHTPLWGPDISADSRRPGWWSEFDNTQVAAAKQIAAWREQKLIPDNARFFNPSLDAANYLAWYAPGARVFIDNRFSLYSEETARGFREARLSLSGGPQRSQENSVDETPAEPAWKAIIKENNINYLLVGEGDLMRRSPALLQRLMIQGDEWTLCYLYGGSAIYGWNGNNAGAAAFARIRYNAGRLAFGRDVEKAPAKRPTTPPEPTWYEIIWQPEPPRSADADNAGIHMMAFEVQAIREAEREAREASVRFVLASGNPLGVLVNGLVSNGLETGWLRLPSGIIREPEAPADLYIAVRAARRALDVNPEDGRAWFRLGQAYTGLMYKTREQRLRNTVPIVRELRHAQLVAALTRAVRVNPELGQVHSMLAGEFQTWYDELMRRRPEEQGGFLDLVLHHREAQLNAMKIDLSAQAARGEKAELLERRGEELKELQTLVQSMQADKKEREDRFELDSANKPPLARAQMALAYGLVESAAKASREHVEQMGSGTAPPQMVAQGLALAVKLFLATGDIEQARELVSSSGQEILRKADDRSLPVPPEFAADWYRVLIAAASGDYEQADEVLDGLTQRVGHVVGRDGNPAVDKNGKPIRLSALIPGTVGSYLLTRAMEATHVNTFSTSFLRAMRIPDGVTGFEPAVQYCYDGMGREADLQTLRAWLALEYGDIPAARRELSDVVQRASKPSSMLNGFRARPLAQMLLGWIEANGGS
jgi:hypothetical protein